MGKDDAKVPRLAHCAMGVLCEGHMRTGHSVMTNRLGLPSDEPRRGLDQQRAFDLGATFRLAISDQNGVARSSLTPC
jgi:hypothetical protein